jgi:hypothetical protein
MCEVGCGYGGLFLAINFFSKILDISVKQYHIVDLPEVCNLIVMYLNANKKYIHIDVCLHDNSTYGKDISDDNLFFISNYCYTEIETQHNTAYSKVLLPKTKNGFILWQNGGNGGSYPVEKRDDILGKQTIQFCEERPQTDAGHGIYKNYFVYY